MTSSEIREQFFAFFRSKGHEILPSAPIVVKNDPTLMFTNAGMNPFKDYFLGNRKSPYPRVADTQKCLRVSGKHNDLEEVGVDTYHHTMFEMLGNWSFGSVDSTAGYFKKEAIAWSWELLTEKYGIEKDRLYVTVFEGDAEQGLDFDEEAAAEWAKWIAPERILKGNKKDNFWEMGDTGPCGPCSEIHVDCRPDTERAGVDGRTLVNADHPQVIEIWNNVFIQYNRKKDGSLEPLPARHVDTGMGFERLVRVLQQKTSNYDTDLFAGTIARIGELTGKTYGYGTGKPDIAFRVLADHIRAISFTIADGQLPSNTGAGYVIRRILRRAVRYYYSGLGYQQPLLYQLVPLIAKQFEKVFPELIQQEAFVTKVIREEEESFLRTLEKGLGRMDSLMEKHRDSRVFNGGDAFELYDTFGFPIDLTRLIAAENDFTVDEAGFEAALKQQQERSRAATAIEAEDWVLVGTEQPTQFLGYEDLNIGTRMVKYRKVAQKKQVLYQLVLERTPFYPESGGQVGDRGRLVFEDGQSIAIADTRRENELIIHIAAQLPKNPEQPLRAIVDATQRVYTAYNHTATHLLHAALKQVLGPHVNQKGSLVSAQMLRFDVSHFTKITDEQLREVESKVNEKIRENIAVQIEQMPKAAALELGAMALFGEKYGELVRVVTIDPAFSIELCGGTHVPHTGMIGLFVITGESAVAAGVRRIEALTGPAALQFIYERMQQHKALSEMLKTKDPFKAVDKLLQEKSALEKKLERLEARELAGLRDALLSKTANINEVNFIGEIVEVGQADALKKLVGELRHQLKDALVLLCANIDGKAAVALAIADSLVASRGLDAGQLIKQQVAPLIKGGGGGQKNLATAGGQEAGNLRQVIEKLKSLL